jgi:hypothetical protein
MAVMLGRYKYTYITAEPLVPGLRRLEVEIAINLAKYKSPRSDQIQAELI